MNIVVVLILYYMFVAMCSGAAIVAVLVALWKWAVRKHKQHGNEYPPSDWKH